MVDAAWDFGVVYLPQYILELLYFAVCCFASFWLLFLEIWFVHLVSLLFVLFVDVEDLVLLFVLLLLLAIVILLGQTLEPLAGV